MNIGTLRAAAADWLLGETPVHRLVLIRVCTGATMFVAYTLFAPYLDGVVGAEGLQRWAAGADALPNFAQAHLGALRAVLLLGALCFTFGLLTPVSGALMIGPHLLIIGTDYHFTYGWAVTMPAFVYYLLLSRCGAAYSLDSLIRRRLQPGWSPPRDVPAWPLRLVQFHVAMIYLTAGWHRALDAEWLRGEMVYSALSHSRFARFPNLDLQGARPVLWALSWYTYVIETSAPLLLWVRPLRPVLVPGLLLLHLGLELGSTVGYWQFMMLTMLLSFLPAHWVAWLFGRLERVVATGATAAR